MIRTYRTNVSSFYHSWFWKVIMTMCLIASAASLAVDIRNHTFDTQDTTLQIAQLFICLLYVAGLRTNNNLYMRTVLAFQGVLGFIIIISNTL